MRHTNVNESHYILQNYKQIEVRRNGMFALNDAADSFRPWRKRPEPLDFASHTLHVSTELCLEIEPLRITSNSL